MKMIESGGANPANQSTSPKYCIFGAGAIGGMIAAQLARAHATVSVIARGETLAAVRKDGLRLIINGEALQTSVRASADPAELGPQDYVIIAVKAPSLPEVASRIGPLLGPETAVVTAMNGIPWWFFTNATGRLAGTQLTSVDPDGLVARAIPATRVIGCVVYMSCAVERPGVIRHAAGRRLIVGEPDNRSSLRVARLAEWLRRAGFDCVESTNIRRDIWFKLWNNLSTNPISLLTAASLDRIIADPLAHALCFRMMAEARRIGEAIGIPATVSIEEILDRARALGAIKTSMLQDAEHGKPVEIDALLTATRDLGRMVGVPTPFIDAVLGLARLKATSLGLLDLGHARVSARADEQYAPVMVKVRPGLMTADLRCPHKASMTARSGDREASQATKGLAPFWSGQAAPLASEMPAKAMTGLARAVQRKIKLTMPTLARRMTMKTNTRKAQQPSYHRYSSYGVDDSGGRVGPLPVTVVSVLDLTEDVLHRSGIKRGMHVLDLGCGAGDASLRMAKLVGYTGLVVGVDESAEVINVAEKRTTVAGQCYWTRFVTADPNTFIPPHRYDVVVVRAALLLHGERATLLRLSAFVHPDGVIIVCRR